MPDLNSQVENGFLPKGTALNSIAFGHILIRTVQIRTYLGKEIQWFRVRNNLQGTTP